MEDGVSSSHHYISIIVGFNRFQIPLNSEFRAWPNYWSQCFKIALIKCLIQDLHSIRHAISESISHHPPLYEGAHLKDVETLYFDLCLVWDNDMVIQFDALDRKLARIVMMRSGSRGQASARGLTSWWWHDTGTTRAPGAGQDHLIIKLLTVTTTIKTEPSSEGNIWCRKPSVRPHEM